MKISIRRHNEICFFPEVNQTVHFEGKDSRNPLSFKYYNAEQKVGGKTMAEHLRFAVAYWHTMAKELQSASGIKLL